MQIIGNYIYIIIKGFIIGASMLVPGFSGGTMAMILGIYDKLIASLSGILTFSKNENYISKNKLNFLFLIFFLHWLCFGNGYNFKAFIKLNRKILYVFAFGNI